MKKVAVLLVLVVALAGCASGRNYQSDTDALNAKASSLQAQLETKNREIAALQDALRSCQGQVSGCTSQIEAANRAKSEAESRLYEALDKLAAQKKSSTVTASKNYVK